MHTAMLMNIDGLWNAHGALAEGVGCYWCVEVSAVPRTAEQGRCSLAEPHCVRAMALALVASIASAMAADPRHAPLLSWMTSCGAELGPIALGKSRCGAGGGAFATRTIEEGEEIFSVPSAACVSLLTACGDEEVGPSLARLVATGQGGATVALAGIIAKEWLCSGAEGPRGPYLAMLPWDAEWPPEGEQEQEHVLWWSEAQIDSLDGSAAYADAVSIRDEVALATRVLTSLIGASVRKAYKDRGEAVWSVWKADDDIARAVRGAFVAILSRAFTQEQESDEEKRLVPLLDMLQHATEPNVRHGALYDEATGAQRVVVRARRRIDQGEELLNSYDAGELAPAKFLTRFGFVPGKTTGEFIQSIGGRKRLPFGFKMY